MYQYAPVLAIHTITDYIIQLNVHDIDASTYCSQWEYRKLHLCHILEIYGNTVVPL